MTIGFLTGKFAPLHTGHIYFISKAATILMANRYSEQWLCWIAVNVTGIVMWALAATQGGEASIAGLMMWVMFFINSVYGYVNWRKNAGYVVS